MYFGSRDDEQTSFAMLDQYVEAGGTFIDTANKYLDTVPGFKGGESEALIGRWMKARGNRDKLFLATKVGFEIGSDVPRRLTAALIEKECDKSLKRLGVDTIDLYYAHTDDRQTPLDETMQAFDSLVLKGKVRFLGASNYAAWRLSEANMLSTLRGWTLFCCIQQRYTYLRPRPGSVFTSGTLGVDEDLQDYVRTRNVTLVAYSPLIKAAYTRGDREIREQYRSADSDARLKVLFQVAEEVGATPLQVVLAWMMQSEPPVIPIFSASKPEQMRENLGALDVNLSEQQMETLNKAGA
jgi:aryl-alcohol dehydrogenase-like predicted oxidoreductase